MKHWSDCAVHNALAYLPGPCDCGGIKSWREGWWGRVRRWIPIACLALLLNGCAWADWLQTPTLSEADQQAYTALLQEAEVTEAAEDPLIRYNRARDAIATLKAQITALPVLTQELKDAVAFLRVIEKKAKADKEALVAAVYQVPPDPLAAKAAQAKAMQTLALMESAIADAVRELR